MTPRSKADEVTAALPVTCYEVQSDQARPSLTRSGALTYEKGVTDSTPHLVRDLKPAGGRPRPAIVRVGARAKGHAHGAHGVAGASASKHTR